MKTAIEKMECCKEAPELMSDMSHILQRLKYRKAFSWGESISPLWQQQN